MSLVAQKNGKVETSLQSHTKDKRLDFPEEEGMWAVAGSLSVRPLLAKVSFPWEQAESKEEEGAEADPPGQREVEAAM